MPWRVTGMEDARKAFVAAVATGTESFQDLCRTYGISRKTGYKLVNRVLSGDPDAYRGHSSRPRSSPNAVPTQVVDLLLQERLRYPDLGATKLVARLSWRHPELALPSVSTVNRILSRFGVAGKRRGRIRGRFPNPGVFQPVTGPNDVWTTDFKGQFHLRNAQLCYPLTILDNHSRFLLRCVALDSTKHESAERVFRALFRERGLPARIRSDNGVPFASHSLCGLSQLSIGWLKLGIRLERIEPGCPEQNGEHERFHRTLNERATRPERSLRRQQQRFNEFQRFYNEERPHAALSQTPPAWHYQSSDRHYHVRETPGLDYPDGLRRAQIRGNGQVEWQGESVFVCHLLAHEPIALEEIAEETWRVYFGPLELGLLRAGCASILTAPRPKFG